MTGSPASELAERLVARGFRLVTAESCTAGLLSATLAEMSGASAYLWGAFVCYSNDSKVDMLGVDTDILSSKGAVSSEVAIAMAEGALFVSGADIAIAVTGLAGPDGDGSPVPVGTVWIATALAGSASRSILKRYEGDRNEIRSSAARDAFRAAIARLEPSSGEEAD